ncbi:hypothetical protein DWU98_03110 [Dyella monticola]|uniref:Uncharacterized protein n=1 Tax=Dyella monticola TaxID=1927958 RepID=A0A370X9K1_9GAMM|nr:hypothetical protein [Dyella monticola]RDS84950.1 hypothetical protein DWU98_03110 [Dyella monticola]
MNRHVHSGVSNVSVNWDDPQLVSLLRRSEQWSIDNRSGFSPQDVHVYLGWSGSVGRPATLVWERDNALVLETTFPIAQGEQVRVDKHLGNRIRTLWGVVVEGREGFREGDRQKGIHVYWLQVSNNQP